MRDHICNWTRFGGNLLQDTKKKIVMYVMYVIPHISNRILDFFWELPPYSSKGTMWRAYFSVILSNSLDLDESAVTYVFEAAKFKKSQWKLDQFHFWELGAPFFAEYPGLTREWLFVRTRRCHHCVARQILQQNMTFLWKF